jgi:hypothetical protein
MNHGYEYETKSSKKRKKKRIQDKKWGYGERATPYHVMPMTTPDERQIKSFTKKVNAQLNGLREELHS